MIALVLASAIAHADPAPKKSRTVALVVPIAVTLGGATLAELGDWAGPGGGRDTLLGVGAGLLAVGPSLGHVYAHDWWSFGLGLRAVGAAVFVEPFVAGENGDQMKFWIAGASIFAVGAVWEIGTAAGAVFDYNRAHAVSIVPTRHGLAIAGSF